MRPLCGAIITAGALIGLGLTSLAIGTRYHTTLETLDKDNKPVPLQLQQMDRPLLFILAFLIVTALIGLGIAFLGLAYHHHRRERELQLQHERLSAGQRTSV